MPRIHDTLPPDGPRRTERTETRRSEKADRSQVRSEPAASDRVELSEDALQAGDMQTRLRAEAQHAPDVREEVVARVRERLAAGEYDTEAVRRAIADRLLNQFGLG